jgi:CBS domain-containing protein
MKVSEAMHLGVNWATPDASIVELARMMREQDVGCIPIGENDRLVGMVTDRDIICRGVADGLVLEKLKARDVMTKGVVWCKTDEELAKAANRMQDRHVRRLPVINDGKRMVGMLALGDVWRHAPQSISTELMSQVSGHH